MQNNVIRYFIFGDSICVGQGVSINKGWVVRIAQDIEIFNLKNSKNILLANSSRNGNTTRQALERMPYDVQSQGVEILSIQFGLNDCNYWDTDNGLPRVSPKSFEANLEEIIARGVVFGAKKIMIHTNHPTLRDSVKSGFLSHSYDENNRIYSQIIRKIAHNNEYVTLIDIEKKFNQFCENESVELKSLLLPDGLHLSVLGHELYYKSISPYINEVLNYISNIKASASLNEAD
ncbi:SGNH/GDSL hydrolase family protein [Legionella nagasakiensis]|uniref:SGNH/GDSL hydrolase family protein n=1 Tax=Legionella nagasakiensis TaxID=535290 RepID=UPI001055A1C5|nr:SGNH/GDSL hydrolase family protein [Legionella nagasakiensis]